MAQAAQRRWELARLPQYPSAPCPRMCFGPVKKETVDAAASPTVVVAATAAARSASGMGVDRPPEATRREGEEPDPSRGTACPRKPDAAAPAGVIRQCASHVGKRRTSYGPL